MKRIQQSQYFAWIKMKVHPCYVILLQRAPGLMRTYMLHRTQLQDCHTTPTYRNIYYHNLFSAARELLIKSKEIHSMGSMEFLSCCKTTTNAGLNLVDVTQTEIFTDIIFL